jgi:glycosyltransferase involved in cell wall biosynthesis
MKTPKHPISVCLIAKNEKDNLEPFYNSFRSMLTHPDDEVLLLDTGSMDGTPEAARDLGMTVHVDGAFSSVDVARLGKKWKPDLWKKYSKHPHFKKGIMADFAAARQQSFNLAKNELCMWIDLDDEIVNAHVLRDIIDYAMDKRPDGNGLALFLRYDYSFDKAGQCDTVLWRERVVTKSDFVWKGKCHETLIPRDKRGYTMVRDPNCPVVIRHRSPKKHEFSDLRNYIILRKDLEIDKHFDPRTLFYIGNACRGLKDHKEAIDWYQNFVTRSGSKDDIMSARINAAYCYSQLDMSFTGLRELAEAQLLDSTDPRVYYTMAAIWAELENWENVITYVKLGDQFVMRDTMHAVDPKTLQMQPALALTQAYRNLGRPDEAVQASERLLRSTRDPKIQQLVEDTRRWAGAEKQNNIILAALRSAKNPEDTLEGFNLSPHILDRGIPIREEKSPGADEGKKTIAFYCGQSATRWGPPSEERGVGASEKMVYEAARRFARRGYNVQVYCRLNRAEGKCEEGIHWYYTGRFNPYLYRDVVIVWRVPKVVDALEFECGKLYIWMHDVGDDRVWTVPRLAKIDGVLFLSEFQRKLHPSVPDDKAYITRNGIDLPGHLYNGTEKKKRIVFFSSPDRGWLTSIGMFRASKLHEQGYELHLFYGFGELWRQLCREHGFGYIVEKGEDNRFYEYEEQCKMAAHSTPGVVFRGRVGWKQMAQELQEAEIWLYPTKFDEISCVAAMEAMAAGLKVVATDHAALKETLKDYPGWWKVDLSSKSVDIAPLISAAKMTVSPKELSKFARKFDMDTLIEEWDKDLIGDDDVEDFRPSSDGSTAKDGEKRLRF